MLKVRSWRTSRSQQEGRTISESCLFIKRILVFRTAAIYTCSPISARPSFRNMNGIRITASFNPAPSILIEQHTAFHDRLLFEKLPSSNTYQPQQAGPHQQHGCRFGNRGSFSVVRKRCFNILGHCFVKIVIIGIKMD